MSKNKPQSYENFLACFAGVYRKHARSRGGSSHTCYVRNAIGEYCSNNLTEEDRKALLEDASGTSLIGYRIALALISQGWDTATIREYADDNQRVVDEIEEEGGDMAADMWERITAGQVEGYPREGAREWASHWNYARWVWFKVGSPNTREIRPLEEFLEKRGAHTVSTLLVGVEHCTNTQPLSWEYLRGLNFNELFGLLANPDVTD